MMPNELFHIANLALFLCVGLTQILAFTNEDISWSYSSSQNNEEMFNTTLNCNNQKTSDDIITYLSNLKVKFTKNPIQSDAVSDLLYSYEVEQRNSAKNQVKYLKNSVRQKAAIAKCPAPDDPTLMGEFDVMIDLISEMCIDNFEEKADCTHVDADKVTRQLVKQIESALDQITLESVPPSKVCTEVLVKIKEDLEEFQRLQDECIKEQKSLYSICYKMAYEHAENFKPSIVQIATTC